MKKNSLTTAVVAGIAAVAGFAGLANAVHMNPDGIGQAVLYPYYVTPHEPELAALDVDWTSGIVRVRPAAHVADIERDSEPMRLSVEYEFRAPRGNKPPARY